MNLIQIRFNYVGFVFLFFIISNNSFSNNSFSDNSLDSLYTVLNQEMINSVEYDKKKELRIANLILELENSKSLEDQYEKRKKLIDEYQYYNLNKAIESIEINLTIAEKLDDLNLNTETLLKFTQLLISSVILYGDYALTSIVNHIDDEYENK